MLLRIQTAEVNKSLHFCLPLSGNQFVVENSREQFIFFTPAEKDEQKERNFRDKVALHFKLTTQAVKFHTETNPVIRCLYLTPRVEALT